MPIKSKRTSTGFYRDPPLTRWACKVEDVLVRDSSTGKKDKAGVPKTEIVFKMIDIKVIEADAGETEPYAKLADDLIVPFSDAVPSKLTFLEDSLAAALGMETSDPTFGVDLMKGKSVVFSKKRHTYGAGKAVVLKDELTGTAVLDAQGKPVVEVQPVVGNIITVEAITGGVPAVNPRDYALGLLEGKTWGEFYHVAATSPTVRRDGNLLLEISQGKDGQFYKDAMDKYTIDPADKFVKK